MQSMDEIYQKYAQMVYRYLLSKTRSEDLAEELTQETFYQAIKSIGRYDGSCKISTWLCAQPGLSGASAETEFLDTENRVELMRKLHSCPEPYREILYLRIFGGLSFKEIGEIMGKTENWARVSYYRAKERLKKEVEENE